jgi:D-psicose/D-tagatose/L-ribulose 3-epimerase
MMRVAAHNWMRAEPIRRTIERLQQTGVQSLAIAGEPNQYDTKEVRALLKEHGRSCWGSVTLTLGARNLVAKDASQRERTVDYMKRVVTMVKELDGLVASVVPATVGKTIPDAPPEVEWRWLVEAMRELHAHAWREGVVLAIEPLNRFETYLINRVDQALALADEVHPTCGVCLDFFHMNIEESDMLAAIHRAKGRILDVHVADNNRFAPGMGTLDFPALIGALANVGYSGALSLEFAATIDRTPANPYGQQVDPNPQGVSAQQLKFLIDHGSNVLADDFYTQLFKHSMRTLLPLLSRLH